MDKLDPRMDARLDKIDHMLTKHIKSVTIGVVAVVCARNLSQAVAMTINDVSRRLVDLHLPLKW